MDPDAALMLRVKAGEHEPFADIVRGHQRPLVNFFARMGVSVSEAEDMAQDTFLRLFKYRQRYEPRAKLSTFLHLLARQVWLDRLRKTKRQEDFRQSVLEQDAQPGTYSSATDAAAARAEEALRRLPDGLRDVVVLGVYQQLPYREIAEVLGIAEGTVKSRMFHAMSRLREEMNRAQTPP